VSGDDTHVRFDYYLHDRCEHTERIEQIAESAGITIDDALAEKIGGPFYEVQLQCTLNTKTGAVTIHGASA
jgi:hypothetical protein